MITTNSPSDGRWARVAVTVLIVVVLVWTGMLAGVSFLATPAKFLAPSLELEVALEVGNRTFMVLQQVELILLALVLVLVSVIRRPLILIALSIGLLGLEALQTLWLQPTLHERTLMFIAGKKPPPSSLHEIYGFIEAVKLLALLAMGIGLLWFGASNSTPSQN